MSTVDHTAKAFILLRRLPCAVVQYVMNMAREWLHIGVCVGGGGTTMLYLRSTTAR